MYHYLEIKGKTCDEIIQYNICNYVSSSFNIVFLTFPPFFTFFPLTRKIILPCVSNILQVYALQLENSMQLKNLTPLNRKKEGEKKKKWSKKEEGKEEKRGIGVKGWNWSVFFPLVNISPMWPLKKLKK